MGLHKRTCGTRAAALRPGAVAGCCGFVETANSKLPIGLQLAKNAHDANAKADASCGPSRGEAAARGALASAIKFSIFNIEN